MGPDVTEAGGEAGVVFANVLKVGAIGVRFPNRGTASVASSASWKVSPRASKGREESQELYSLKYKFYISVKYSDTVLTFSGAYGVKVRTAASIVHTHGVTLTFVPRAEGATATHTGLCGNAVCLFQREMA